MRIIKQQPNTFHKQIQPFSYPTTKLFFFGAWFGDGQ